MTKTEVKIKNAIKKDREKTWEVIKKVLSKEPLYPREVWKKLKEEGYKIKGKSITKDVIEYHLRIRQKTGELFKIQKGRYTTHKPGSLEQEILSMLDAFEPDPDVYEEDYKDVIDKVALRLGRDFNDPEYRKAFFKVARKYFMGW